MKIDTIIMEFSFTEVELFRVGGIVLEVILITFRTFRNRGNLQGYQELGGYHFFQPLQ